MNGATRLLEELVQPNLDAGNIQNLREWSSKIDAALALAKLIPYAGDQINEQIRQVTGGNFNADELDVLIHEVIDKYDREHPPQ